MAKRKLSAEQRSALRADLKKGPQGEESIADLLRRVSKEYGITTITARWYLNSLDGAPRGRAAGKRGPGRPPGRSTNKGDSSALLKRVELQSAALRAANKIAPRLQKLAQKEADLQRQLNRTQKKLQSISMKASRLRKQLEDLVGR